MNLAKPSAYLSAVSLLGLALAGTVSGADQPAPQPAATAAAEPQQGPPLPAHTIEGYGGGAITPTAYLVNPGPKEKIFGLPALSGTVAFIGEGKNLEAFGITETLFGRVELGYGAERFGLGDWKGNVKDATGIDIHHNEVYMHNFNLRGLLIEENAAGQNWIPAVTVGLHYKYNEDIDDINKRLGGAVKGIGYSSDDGFDFTLTASKTFAKVFDRPLIVSAGLRNSSAAWTGYLGFADTRETTFEGNLVYMPLDWLAVGYEYRQKADPYRQIPGLVGNEDALQTVDVIFMPNKQLSIALVYGAFGNALNAHDNGVAAMQVKWQF